MKNFTLAVAAMITMGHVALAAETRDRRVAPVHATVAEPISFIERGVEFFVFMDGQFDFNTEGSATGGLYYKGGRPAVNKTYGVPGNNRAGGTIVEHDNQGRVRRVGNVFINYDAANRIKRIGSVYMSYNRNFLTQIGGLRITYDRSDRVIDYSGSVKGRGVYVASGTYYGPASNYNNYSYNDNLYYRKEK